MCVFYIHSYFFFGLQKGFSLQAKGPNHYSLLGVTRDSNPLEIKRAYKKLSLQLHPDKNPSPNASHEFDKVKQAYDVLMDMELRDVYNKFGQEGIQSNKRYSESQFFMELGVFYVTWGMLAYVLTLGKSNGDARQWTFTGMIVMLVAEITIMTSTTNPLPTSMFPTWTEYEVVWLLHSLFPAFMNGCRSLGSYLYVDLDKQTRQLLLALQEQNKDILLVLRDVQIGVQTIQVNGSSRGIAMSSTAGMPVSTDQQQGTSSSSSHHHNVPTLTPYNLRATPTGKIKELQDRLRASHTTVSDAVKDLKMDGNKNSSIGIYTMIFGYILFSYIFNK